MQANFVLELPNDLRAIERSVELLVERCREAGFDEGRLRFNFRIGVTEALANAMLYGNARDPNKRVIVEADFSPRRVVVRVTDEGRGFDPDSLPDPTLPATRCQAGGRGLFLIRNLMDEVAFNEQGNSITMVLLGAALHVTGGRNA